MQIVEDVKFLKQKSVGFDFSTDFQVLENLKKTIEVKDNAAGLAAPQIGQLKRVFVGKIDGIQFFINPKIEKFENPFINKKEGCLSFPGKRISTIRYNNVWMSFFDEKERFHENIEFSNFSAILVMHEFEHLEGKLMMECQPPEKYDECFCGSGKKFKFCCSKFL